MMAGSRKPRKKKRSDGKLLERLVELIQITLADHPSTSVRKNVKLKDQGGDEYEIDVLVETTINETLAVRILFECKDHARKIERKYLQAFAKQCEQLKASKGVFVSTHGFQPGAISTAKTSGIELLELRDLFDNEDGVSRIKGLLDILGVKVVLEKAGYYAPDLPDDAPVGMLTPVYESDRHTKMTMNDLAQLQILRDRPPTSHVLPGTYARNSRWFGFKAGNFFLKHRSQFYALLGIGVEVVVIKGIPLDGSGAKRLSNTLSGDANADVAMFRMPVEGGIGNIGAVVSKKTGKTTYVFEVPGKANLPGPKTVVIARYRREGREEVEEKIIHPASPPTGKPGLIGLEYSIEGIPKGSQVLSAVLVDLERLLDPSYSPLRWSVY